MPHYIVRGQVPPKRHTQFRRPDGELYGEELIGAEGFSGDSSLCYHTNPPTEVVRIGAAERYAVEYATDAAARHRLVNGAKLAPGGDWLSGRKILLGNSDLRIALCRPTEPMPWFYRNAEADELVFVHDGSGVLESPFGHLAVQSGDYVMVPRTIPHRWVFAEADEPPRLLVVESLSSVKFPKRYLSATGQFLETSPFCERDLRLPEFREPFAERGEHEVRIRKDGWVHPYVFRNHPCDLVGWDGCLYPYAFSIHEFEPITGRVHQPPPVHQTFEAHNFVVCSFVPRKFDYHPLSIPAPYHHSNIDSDEVLYYAEGNFMSRKGVGHGDFSLHPAGLPHGPHPGTIEASIGKEGTEEIAVMIDTFRPLRLTQAALDLENPDYADTWLLVG